MHRRRTHTALAAAAACLLTLGSAGAAQAAARHPPPGYGILDTNQMPAPQGMQTRGVGQCPTGTVPLGGGVVVSSTSTLASVSASFPEGRFWVGIVSNDSGADTTFQVEVECAKRPPKYTVVQSGLVRNPSGLQSSVLATCPAGTRPLGGGGESTSPSVFENLNSTGPQGRAWFATENNATGADAGLEAFAVCGAVHAYRVVKGTAFGTPAGGQGNGTAACPAPSVATGGGVFSASTNTLVNVGGSVPVGVGGRWSAFVNDAAGVPATATAVAVCATR